MSRAVSRAVTAVAPHAAVGFSVGLGLGLHEETVDGLLFAALAVVLLVLLQAIGWVWPLAFPRS